MGVATTCERRPETAGPEGRDFAGLAASSMMLVAVAAKGVSRDSENDCRSLCSPGDLRWSLDKVRVERDAVGTNVGYALGDTGAAKRWRAVYFHQCVRRPGLPPEEVSSVFLIYKEAQCFSGRSAWKYDGHTGSARVSLVGRDTAPMECRCTSCLRACVRIFSAPGGNGIR